MRCIVEHCPSNQNRRDEEMSFHRFPELDMKRDLWIAALKLRPEEVSKRSIVCSSHFVDDDFHVDIVLGRRRLKPSAIPFLAEDPLSTNHASDTGEGYDSPIYDSYGEDTHFQDVDLAAAITGETRALEISVVTYKQHSSPEYIFADSCPTTPRKSDADTSRRLKELESEVRNLKRTIVERNRGIKVLNTKLRFKSERIRKLAKEISKLKKKKRNLFI